MILYLIIGMSVAWGLCWLAMGIADHVAARRPLPRVRQPARYTPRRCPPIPVRAPVSASVAASPAEKRNSAR